MKAYLHQYILFESNGCRRKGWYLYQKGNPASTVTLNRGHLRIFALNEDLWLSKNRNRCNDLHKKGYEDISQP